MAEKEITIKVSTQADTSEVEDLGAYLNELQENGTINLNVEADTSSITSLQEELSNAESEVENLENELMNIELGNIEGDFDKVSQELAEAQARVEELSSNFDDLTNSVTGSSDEVSDLQGNIDLLNAQALIGIGQEISSLGSQAEGMAQEMNTAAISVGQLATQTGVAEPQMVSLINHISNATFPNNEAMLYVKSLDQIGVSSENLGKSATDLDKINDAFHMGAERTNSLGQELSVLGVDMNNVSSSFNALAYANSNTVGGMENYYNFLRRYDAQFNELGLNVDQASIIIAGATQKFGGGRAALTGLSTALKEADGDTRALEEALGLQAGSLDNASQITGQYEGQLQTLANEEAEHKTLLDQVGAAWEDLSLSISPALGPLTSFLGLIGQAGGWAVGVNGINTLVKSLTGLNILEGVGGRLGGLRGRLLSLGGAARGAGSSLLLLGKNLGSTVLDAVKNGIVGFGSLAKEVLTAGLNALRAAGMWLVQKVQLLGSAIAGGVATVQNWLLAVSEWAVASPILVVVTVIGLLIAALAYLYFNNEQVRTAVNGLGQTFMWVGQLIYTSFVNAVNWVIGALQNLWNYIITLGGLLPANVSITGNQIVDTILRVVLFILTLPLQIQMVFLNIIAKTLGFGDNFVQNMITTATKSVTNFMNQIKQLPGKLSAELQNMLSAVGEWAASLPQKFWDAGVNAVKNFLSALGIHSPGIMQRTLVWEISEMAKRTPVEGRSLLSNISDLGEGVVDSFGNPRLNVDANSIDDANFLNNTIKENNNNNGGGFTQVNEFYFSDIVVDDDKRMEKIYDYFTKRLNFDNTTAGRTV